MRETRSRPIELAAAVLLGAAVALLAGCTPKPQRSPMMKTRNVELTATQMRIATHVFVDRFSAIVEDAADEILAATGDRGIRQNALLWKINAISTGQRAGFQDDPMAGYLDLWILSEQMVQFFEEGPGSDVFGEYQSIAVDASRHIVLDAEQFARELSGQDLTEINRVIEEWVDDNPVESLSFGRVSTRTIVLTLVKKHAKGAFAAIGSLDEGISELADRSTIYAEYIPKIAIWQVEYLFNEIMAREDIAGAVRNAGELSDALQGIDGTAGELMMLLDRGIAETLPAEREILTDFIEEQRLATLDDVRKERVAILEALAREREIVLAAVTAERIAVMESLGDVRADTLVDMEQVIDHTMSDSWMRIEELVDRIFLRATLLFGALIAVMIVFGFAALRVIRTIAS